MGALEDLTRPAGDEDVVGGVQARLVAAPASTAEASALVKAAAGLAVVVRGAATKIEWGTPPRELDLIIDTRRLAGVREHAAGDLITVLGAGTRLADLDLPGQQLALDSPAPGATIGGTVATNVSGPRRVLYGTARDLLIGIEVVRADGTVARSGGKVVKNVAGYDLGKLFTGSYGTLGLITECAFRLHPLPAATAVITATAHSPADAGRLIAAVLGAQVVASAIEVNAPPTGDLEVAVLVEGTATGVRDRAAIVAKAISGHEGPPPQWWGTYPWSAGDVALKLTAPLSRVPDLLAAAAREAQVTVRGSAGSGVLYAGLPAPPPAGANRYAEQGVTAPPPGGANRYAEQGVTAPPPGGANRYAEQGVTAPPPGGANRYAEQSGAEGLAGAVARLREAATRAGGHAVVLTAPADVRAAVDMWGPVGGIELMRRVKDQFDPEGRFAPGRFAGGI